LLGAARVAIAGDVVCIAPGTYTLTSTFESSHSGNSSAWITYTAYGSQPVNIVWAGPSGQAMFHFYGSTFPNGPSYLEFKGLTLNGKNVAADGFFCQQSHHIKYIGNTVNNMAAAGIASVKCDYQTADHNVVYHNGYNGGWSSGISFNSSQWYDSYSGFHNIVSNNIVAGSYDSSTNHSDGNGIIMDLSNGSYTASSANTPAALIANNVVYGNGGRCIENFIVSNIWVVNNTCYDNTLDTSQPGIGEIVNNNSKNIHYVNNVVKAWNSSHPFQIMGSYSTGITYSSNLIYGGSNSGASGSGFTTANPQFVNPPSYNATSGGQYANTISPTSLGNGLNLQSTSPAINAGIDPISLTSNSNLKSDMSSCIYQDINGNARPVGGPFTLGAYQH
jgi:serralysin